MVRPRALRALGRDRRRAEPGARTCRTSPRSGTTRRAWRRCGRSGCDDADQHLEALAKLRRRPGDGHAHGLGPLSADARGAHRRAHPRRRNSRPRAATTPPAIAALREAVAIEDQIPYDEPPGWHAPVRQTLGALLLAAGQPAEAEAVYREELKRNPDNGWSLYGLAQSLRAQKREAEAKDVDGRFAKAWQNADIKLTASRM